MGEHSELPYRYGNTSPDQVMILAADGQYVCNVQIIQFGGGMVAEAMQQSRRERAAFIVLACNNHDRLTCENEAMRKALEDCLGCVTAAEAEGLHEVTEELRGFSEQTDRLVDLVERRLLWVRNYAEPALSSLKEGTANG